MKRAFGKIEAVFDAAYPTAALSLGIILLATTAAPLSACASCAIFLFSCWAL